MEVTWSDNERWGPSGAVIPEETTMTDTDLRDLLSVLDHLAQTDDETDLHAQLDRVEARLDALQRRHGELVAASPYLQFLRRTAPAIHEPQLAASA